MSMKSYQIIQHANYKPYIIIALFFNLRKITTIKRR